MKSLTEFYNREGHYKWQRESFLQDRVKKMLLEIQILLTKNDEKFNVLDIGSGSGDFIKKIKNKYKSHSYYGCDVADKIIKTNLKNKKGISWTTEDFNYKSSYKNNFFDIIIAGEVIEHLYNTDGFLLEVSRILKKGGLFLITTPNLASWLDRLTLVFGMQPFSTEVSNRSRKFGREQFYRLLHLKDDSSSAGHLRCFTKSSLKSLLEYYKFQIIKDIPCNVHDDIVNKIITFFLPNMSENIFFITQKLY